MSIRGGKDKEDVAHIYNGLLLGHEREGTVPFAETQTDLETVLQNEVSQKKKNKCCILTHICGILKNGTDEPVWKAEIETQREQKHGPQRGKKGGGGGN